MLELGVSIDHIATIRQARKTYEPDFESLLLRWLSWEVQNCKSPT